ncbi:MAG: TlyA family RNA methyltransferase [Pseudomonadota bacterium]|nr:TlyA family RNA methyltransferase [Pseudomonadota bacterium]
MQKKIRLDKLLVVNGLVNNVNKAKALIMAGKVLVNEKKIEKPGTKFTDNIVIRLLKKSHDWVSRGGIKLSYALDKLNLNLEDRVCADLGSSTGGFTDVLLKQKVKHIYCVDVGKGLLDWKIVKNNNVTVIENTNVRNLNIEDIDPNITFLTCDLSFISLTKALEKIVATKKINISIMALIKPQFELSKDMIGKKGIVTNENYKKIAINKVRDWFKLNGWKVSQVIKSPITGAAGNEEFFIYCEK